MNPNDGTSRREPIAIVGTGCRFAGSANSSSELWELLKNPRDLSQPIPRERFDWKAFYHHDSAHHGTSNVSESYFLDQDVGHFDANFFNIKPVEASSIDPQQRLLLEVVYEGLEDAGLTIGELSNSQTAVYVGLMCGDYSDILSRDVDSIPPYQATGIARSLISNRISHFFNWHGPSVTLDTACSSSLVALHQAVQTLRLDDSRVAVVAGSNLLLTPEPYITESKMHMLSPTGRCHMWDVAADGYARGEGVAAVVLKTLKNAIADGDNVLAVVREIGVNQDGKTPGITMPSNKAQTDLIRRTYVKAGLDPTSFYDQPQYFEAHGTGTQVGDRVESHAICDAFCTPTFDVASGAPAEHKIFVGSIKTVVGHTEGTAGIAGLMKAALAIKNKAIPPNLHFNRLNPKLEEFVNNWPALRIPSTLEAWPVPPGNAPRRASINSFGFGGTNVHVILESYDDDDQLNVERKVQTPLDLSNQPLPFVFSAASQSSLRETLQRWLSWLQAPEQSTVSLSDVCTELGHRRSVFPHRVSLVASGVVDLCSKLSDLLSSDDFAESVVQNYTSRQTGSKPQYLCVFTGQGAQWATMGAGLLRSSPMFRASLAKLQSSLDALVATDRPLWRIVDELCAPKESSRIARAEFSQPLCTAVQIGLTDLLKATGLDICAVVGHSSGEIAAAYAAGYISADDAIRVAYLRGRLFSQGLESTQQRGAMLAVSTSPEDAAELCALDAFRGRLCVAAHNSSTSVTLSGDEDAVKEAAAILQDEGRWCRQLSVERAYHSHHMLPFKQRYVAALQRAGITLQPRGTSPRCKWFSSLRACDTDTIAQFDICGYWADNLVCPVLFREALTLALRETSNFDAIIEIGPHPALKTPALSLVSESLSQAPPYLSPIIRFGNEVESLSKLFITLWESFSDATTSPSSSMMTALGAIKEPRRVCATPRYSWDHTRSFWHDSSIAKAFQAPSQRPHELLGRLHLDGSANTKMWRNILSAEEIDWIECHRIQTRIVFPAGGMISIAFEAVTATFDVSLIASIELQDFVILRALTFEDEHDRVETQCALTSIERTEKVMTASFELSALNKQHDTFEVNARCTIKAVFTTDHDLKLPDKQYPDFLMIPVDNEHFYRTLDQLGYGYSGPFKALSTLQRKLGYAKCTLSSACNPQTATKPFMIHPAVADAVMQSVILAHSYPGDTGLTVPYLPVSVRRICLDVATCNSSMNSSSTLTVHTTTETNRDDHIEAESAILEPVAQQTIISFDGVTIRPLMKGIPSSDLQLFSRTSWHTSEPCFEPNAIEYLEEPPQSNGTWTTVNPHRRAAMNVVEQVLNIHPGVEVLEIATGPDSMAGFFSDKARFPFSSYTLACPSPESTNSATSIYQDRPEVDVRALDIKQDYAQQGLEKQYGLVLLSRTRQTATEVESQLRNIRAILKPGGYLFVLDVLDTASVGQGLSQHDLRASLGQVEHQSTAYLNPVQWQGVLTDAGFSGVDAQYRPEGDSSIPYSVLITQAIDERVMKFRDPLHRLRSSDRFPVVTVVGGATHNSTTVRQIADLLSPHYRTVKVTEHLNPDASADTQIAGDVVMLCELDEPFFLDFTADKLAALQRMFQQSRNVTWIIDQAMNPNTHADLVAGLSRTLVLELPHLNFRLVRLMHGDRTRAQQIAEACLRTALLDEWQKSHEDQDMLLKNEPEIQIHERGTVVPRVKFEATRNDRYNSARRQILHQVDLVSSKIRLIPTSSSYMATISRRCDVGVLQRGTISIHVDLSSLQALELSPRSYQYIVMGTDVSSGEKYLTVSPRLDSYLEVDEYIAVKIDSTQSEDCETIFALFVNSLIAQQMCSDMQEGDVVVLLDPTATFYNAYENVASQFGVQVTTITTSSSTTHTGSIALHPMSTLSEIRAAIPSPIHRVISFNEQSEFTDRLQECLPPACQFTKITQLLLHQGTEMSKSSTIIQTLLSSAWATARVLHRSTSASQDSIRTLETITQSSDKIEAFDTIVNWQSGQTMNLPACRAEDMVELRGDVSYWLVGLRGDLGLSLARWMSERGAKTIVIASRNPQIDQNWVDMMQSRGTHVLAESVDVTNRASLQALYDRLRMTAPPVAGVINGAMVLRDRVFSQVTYKDFEAVMAPKVTGSQNLDDLFYNVNLDFFMLMSSSVSIIGNVGQSVYGAANTFMASLAYQRRQRGLHASVVNIGAIIGLGVVTRELNAAQQEHLRQAGNVLMSETDFHQMMAEGILAGQEITEKAPEITTGLHIGPSEIDTDGWKTNPIFSHIAYTLRRDETTSSGQTDARATLDVLASSDTKQMRATIESLVLGKLQRSLQIEINGLNLDRALEELGVDSLIAVEITSWFAKDFGIDVPILKVLGGASIQSLIDLAFDSISERSSAQAKNTDSSAESKDTKQVSSEVQSTQSLSRRRSTTSWVHSQKLQPTEKIVVPTSISVQSQSSSPTTSMLEKTTTVVLSKIGDDEKTVLPSLPSTKRAIPAHWTYEIEGAEITNCGPEPTEEVEMIPTDTESVCTDVQSTSSRVSASTRTSRTSTIFSKYTQDREDIKSPVFHKWAVDGDRSAVVNQQLPLSLEQKRFWFLQRLMPKSFGFNVTSRVDLTGHLNISLLGEAVDQVCQAHQILRTKYDQDRQAQPFQIVMEKSIVKLHHSSQCDEEAIQKQYQMIRQHRYDLEKGDIMQLSLMSINEQRHTMIIGYHHICMDAWSLEVFLSEVQRAYRGLRPQASVQYNQHVQKQAMDQANNIWKSELTYWREKVPQSISTLPVLNRTSQPTRPKMVTAECHNISMDIPASLTSRLTQWTRSIGTQPMHGYLSALSRLIFTTTEIPNVCIGVTDAARRESGSTESLGLFVNIYPTIFGRNLQQSHQSAVQETRSEMLHGFSNSNIPIDVLINELNVPRHPGHNPLFQVLFNYRKGLSLRRQAFDCQCDVKDFALGDTTSDLGLDVIEDSKSNFSLTLSVQKSIYTAEQGRALLNNLVSIVDEMCSRPQNTLGRLNSEQKIPTISTLVGDTKTPSTHVDTLLHQLDITSQALGSKHAIVGSGRHVTYSELQNKVSNAAGLLSAMCPKPNARIGVYLEPGIDSIVSLLAIMRAGAAYVPLDPKVPVSRLALFCSDCDIDLVICNEMAEVTGLDVRTCSYASLTDGITISRPVATTEESTAAILYTSGSTGGPKGVCLSQANLSHSVRKAVDAWGITKEDVMLQQSSCGFDMSLCQILVALNAGATLCVASRDERLDPTLICRLMQSCEVTVTLATPTEYASWLDYGSMKSLKGIAWRTAISGGEVIRGSLMKKFTDLDRPELSLINAYGPTEITFCSHSAVVDYRQQGSERQALKRWPDVSTVIVDDEMNALPVGAVGQICVGGAGVAQGYVNNASSAKFVEDSQASSQFKDNKWTKLHLTGDAGFLTTEGDLVITGRVAEDTQVKVRGVRMDLCEIEQEVLRVTHGTIQQCVIALLEPASGSNKPSLVAFVTRDSSATNTDTNEIRKLCLGRLSLPQYMHPSRFVWVDSLPLTTSGKLDRRALVNLLPEKDSVHNKASSQGSGHIQILNVVQQVWKEVLGTRVDDEELSTDAEFFHVGGTSLLLLELQEKINKAFEKEIPLASFFEHSTLGAMTSMIEPQPEVESMATSPKVTPNALGLRIPAVSKEPSEHDFILEPQTAIKQKTPEVVFPPAHLDTFDHDLFSSKDNKSRKSVILTGATGFIGKAILRRLVRDPSVGKVHCIAVREASAHNLSDIKSNKIAVYHGDLRKNDFGLTDEEIENIFGTSSRIVHNAASTSLMQSYRSISQVNTLPTQRLAQLAIRHNVQFHYISTASVTRVSNQSAFGEESLDRFSPSAAADECEGYIASKLASEWWLEDAAARSGLPVWIHRPSLVTGAHAPASDVMSNLRAYAVKTQAIPEPTSEWTGYIDMVKVTTVAGNVAAAVLNKTAPTAKKVTYTFESGDVEVPVAQMRSFMEASLGYRLRSLSMDRWVDEAVRHGMPDTIAAYLRGAADMPISLPRLVKRARGVGRP